MSENWLAVLRDVGVSKGIIALFLASATALGLAHFGSLPEPMGPFVPWIWICLFVTGAFVCVDVIDRLWKKWANRPKPSPPKTDHRQSTYRGLDKEEQAALRVFVDSHVKVLKLNVLRPDKPILDALVRLQSRGFLMLLPQHHSLRDQSAHLYDEHFKALISNPDWVGSEAMPKTFG